MPFLPIGNKKPWSLKYGALFVGIQLASFVLMLVGIPLCAVLALTGAYVSGEGPTTAKQYHWKYKVFWLWDNSEDGIAPAWYNPTASRWKIYTWTAWRNSVNNLRFVKGVSDPSRPFSVFEWNMLGRRYIAIWGWNQNVGYIVMSGGRNENAW